MKKKPKVPTSIKLDKQIFEKGKKLAEQSSRSFAQYIQFLIKKAIQIQESKK